MRRWRRRPGPPRGTATCSGDGNGPDGAEPPTDWRVVLRRPRVGADRRRRVVPAPLRPGAAGPQLGDRRGPGRLPHDAAVLVGPRRRRVPDRRGAPARQGRVRHRWGGRRPAHAGADPGRVPGRTAPVRGPRRGPRDLPDLARPVRRVRPASDGRGRGLGRRPPPGRVRATGGSRAGVQLRPAPHAVGRGGVHQGHHREPGAVGRGRRVVDVGVLEPRHGPPRHALRRAERRRPRRLAARGGSRPGAGPRARPAPGPGSDAPGARAPGLDLRLPGRGAGPAQR